ncbi:MAG: hypothetical protein ACM3W4_10590 [Ignavibacteriales bacterium]
MGYGPITEEQFSQALDRLGQRDVLKLVRAGAFDGAEAVWAAAWLRGERPAKKTQPVLMPQPEEQPAQEEASPARLSLLRAFRAA